MNRTFKVGDLVKLRNSAKVPQLILDYTDIAIVVEKGPTSDFMKVFWQKGQKHSILYPTFWFELVET